MKTIGLWIQKMLRKSKPQAERLNNLEQQVSDLREVVERLEQSVNAIKELPPIPGANNNA